MGRHRLLHVGYRPPPAPGLRLHFAAGQRQLLGAVALRLREHEPLDPLLGPGQQVFVTLGQHAV